MRLPCDTCTRRTSRESGHRRFVGCNDPAVRDASFRKDDWTYRHTCKACDHRPECADCDKRQGDYCMSVVSPCPRAPQSEEVPR